MAMTEPHLDVDQLGAAVDDHADDGVRAHLAACPSCREQLATWRSALAGLTVPEPPGAAQTDAAIAAAMAAWVAPGEGRHRSVGPTGRPGRPRRRAAAAVRPAAASLVVVGLVAAILAVVHLGGGHLAGGHGSESSAGPSVTVPGPARSPAGGPAAAAGAGSTGSATAGASAGSGRKAAPSAPATATPGTTVGGGQTPSPSAPAPAPTVGGQEPASPAPTPGARLVAADAAALAALVRRLPDTTPAPVPAGTPCRGTAETLGARNGLAGRAVAARPVRFAGVDGEVVVFERGGGRLALVLSTPGCRLLATLAV